MFAASLLLFVCLSRYFTLINIWMTIYILTNMHCCLCALKQFVQEKLPKGMDGRMLG